MCCVAGEVVRNGLLSTMAEFVPVEMGQRFGDTVTRELPHDGTSVRCGNGDSKTEAVLFYHGRTVSFGR